MNCVVEIINTTNNCGYMDKWYCNYITADGIYPGPSLGTAQCVHHRLRHSPSTQGWQRRVW